jgi:amidophosphoribosyltransferase
MREAEEKVRHNCGIAVAHSLEELYNLLRFLQHRGREAAGIAGIGETIDVIKWIGKVERFDLIDLEKILPGNKFHTFIGHVRYATRGAKTELLKDAHPHVIGGIEDNREDHIIIKDCDSVIIHNGQVNDEEIIHLANSGCDSLGLLKYYKKYDEIKLMQNIVGAYTLVIANKNSNELIVMRDRLGIRPGVIGVKNEKHVFASEDIAIRRSHMTVIANMKPGTIYYLSLNGNIRKKEVISQNSKMCFFENNYIGHVDSVLNNIPNKRLRNELGRELYKEFPFDDADIITYLPRCPEPAARTYAEVSNKKFLPVFYKISAERAFQGSNSTDRQSSISKNLHLLPDMENQLKNKVIVLIDDSTIRGNNVSWAIDLLKKVGVKKIYHLNYTPKVGPVGKNGILHGCIYGVDMPPEDNFVVRKNVNGKPVNRTDKEINEATNTNTYFLSYEGLLNCFEKCGLPKDQICTFCIGGKKPF